MSAPQRGQPVSEASQERLRLARRLAATWTAQPGCIAVMVVGSAAEGSSDAGSDLDMGIFWAQPPDRSVLETVKSQLGSGEHILFLGEPEQGGCVEAYRIEGIKTDFAHSTLELWHSHTDDVLVQLNLDSPWQKGMSGTLNCLPLYGSERIAELQARLRPYPENLRLAMLQRYSRFTPLYALERQALKRGDLLFAYQLLTEYMNNLLFSLCAINGVYHAMEFKRLARFVEQQLPIAPQDLPARLDRALLAEPSKLADQIAPLVRETLELVAQHCPAFDVQPVLARFELVI